jgi:hypothetical protein
MSIAEKLTTIAENQQKVYDAGFAAGKTTGGGGAEPVIEALTVTENGTYTAPVGVDGYSPVNVNVNIPTDGEENLLKYVSSSGNVQSLFYLANFGGKDSIKAKMLTPPATISQMFARAVGFRKLTVDLPTTQAYAAYRFIYGYSGGTATIEELVLPDGIKFSDFQDFARHDVKLKTISFINLEDGEVKGIDLSSCTNTANCFYGCKELVDVRFVQNSIKLSISFAYSTKLSKKSINSIIEALVNSSDITGQTLTLSRAAVDAAFLYVDYDDIETPGSSSPEWMDTVGNIPNWTISLV